MFKHKKPADVSQPESPQETVPTIMSKTGQPATAFESSSGQSFGKDVSPAALRDLMEKNLKWSQILYEQNRKINRKIFWFSFAGWVRTLCVAIPILLALWYLPGFYQKYAPIFEKLGNTQSISNPANLQDILKILPLSDADKERAKTLLK